MVGSGSGSSNNQPVSSDSSSGGGGVDSAQCWDSISDLESAFHHSFMRSRVATGEFVYLESPRLTRELDEFCDADAMHQPRGPVILLGESGVGKSAFLANWLVRRKKMFQSSQTAYPEFTFYHVVGCSRQSCFVANLLERILRELKEYFELSKEVPDVEERLGWQLPRFLEAAAKKGRVVLVVDGLQRLRTSNGESILKWIPLAFPPNVRVIFSGTTSSASSSSAAAATKGVVVAAVGTVPGGSSSAAVTAAAADSTASMTTSALADAGTTMSSEHHERASFSAQMIERIKLEAIRRKWTCVHVPSLTESERQSIVRMFLHKHKPTISVGGKRLSRAASVSEHGGGQSAARAESVESSGLQLLELQEKAIVAVAPTASPNFLQIFLGCLAWAADAGFNIHDVFESWLSAESMAALIEAVLRSMETGYSPTPQGVDDARKFLVENDRGPESSSRGTKITADIKSTTNKHQLSAAIQSVSGFERSRHGSCGEVETSPSKDRGHSDAHVRDDPAHRIVMSSIVELKKPVGDALQRRSTTTTVCDERFSGGSNSSSVSSLTRIERAEETKRVFVSTLHNDVLRAGTVMSPAQGELTLGSASPSLSSGGLTSVPLPSSPSSPVRAAAGDSSSNSSCSPSRSHSPPRAHEKHHHPKSARVLMRPKSLLEHGKSECVPAYLSGGRHVAPLGKLLGHALCLLYVCRHGLLSNELRFVLNAVVLEETASPQRRATFTKGKSLDKQAITSFSDGEWKALLRAMRQLGVLFVQDVVVLPICKEVLRDVVWWRYVGSESREHAYHKWLIRFFRIHPTTFRRVEELPWHLQRCSHWDALRSVLVDLPMFQLLYTANYKHELFGYWKTLTDGPLLVYNAAATGGSNSSSSSFEAPPTYVQPFDVVREYGKSVEDWYKSARLATKMFTPVVELVTKFMFEFSLTYQGCLPEFSYTPLDLRRLYEDGFLFAKHLPHVQLPASAAVGGGGSATMASASYGGGGMPLAAVPSSTSATAATLAAALDAFPTLGHGAGGSSISNGSGMSAFAKDTEATGNWFYFYQRWVWIHFPWLALGKEITIREPFVTHIDVTGGSASSSNVQGGGSTPTQRHGSSSKAAGGGALDAKQQSTAVGDSGDEEKRAEDQELVGLAASPAANNVDGGSSATSAKSIVHFDARFWDVKRSMFESAMSADMQPRTLTKKKRKGVVSPSKLAALQNASVQSQGPTTKSQDVIRPDHLFSKKATYLAVTNALSSSVRRLPTAVASASLPLASVSEFADGRDRSGKSTTFLTDDLDELEAEDTGGGVSVPSSGSRGDLHAPRDLVLDRMSDTLSSSPSTAFGLPAHFQDYPQTEWDLKQAYNHQVVLKLQTLYDAMKAEVAKKHAHVKLVKGKIKETATRYELAMRDCEMAKRAISEMGDRMARVERMVSSIEQQEKSHRKLLRGCEAFPACEPAHLDAMKKQLKLLQMQLRDLTEERKVLHVKKTRLQAMELPLLRSAIDKSKKLMSAVVERLEKARAKVAQDQAATEKLYQRRLEMIATVHSDTVRSSSSAASSVSEEDQTSSSASSLLAGSATTHSLAAKVALQQCEAMVEKIQKATGYSKLELILHKFVSREELNRSFEEQAATYEARLKQIKHHRAELEQQLKALEASNATVTLDDPRVLEEKLRVAELELARVERTHTSLLTTSKDVIGGVSRIAKLLGITSCRHPYEGAVPALQLWPPSVGFDSASGGLLAEFEALGPKEIAELLHACQERASLMIDAVRADE